MKLSVTSAPWALEQAPVLLRGDMKTCVQQAKKLSYQAIEIHTDSPQALDGKTLRDYCEQEAMSVSAVASGMAAVIYHLCYLDAQKEKRAVAVERTSQYVDLASDLGCGVILGSLRGSIPDLSQRDLYLERFSQCLEKILEQAEKKNVDLYVEVLNRYESNYFNTAAETLDYVNRFGSDHLFVHLDTFHMNIEESDPAEAVRVCGKKLGYLHLADSDRKYVGSGTFDFSKILKAAREIQYKGFFSVECLPLPSGETAARLSMENIRKLADGLT